MKFLARLWKEITRGENLDLYLTVIVALSLTVLNLMPNSIIGFDPKSQLEPLVLAVLALLAFSMLGNRHALEDSMRSLEENTNRTITAVQQTTQILGEVTGINKVSDSYQRMEQYKSCLSGARNETF